MEQHQRSTTAFVDLDRENFSHDFDMIPLLFPVYSKTAAFANKSVICYNEIMSIFDIFEGADDVLDILNSGAGKKIPAAQVVNGPIGAELLVVEDIFPIPTRGVVVTGTALAPIAAKQTVILRRTNGEQLQTTVAEIQSADTVKPGDTVSILLAGVDDGQVSKGDQVFMAE